MIRMSGWTFYLLLPQSHSNPPDGVQQVNSLMVHLDAQLEDHTNLVGMATPFHTKRGEM